MNNITGVWVACILLLNLAQAEESEISTDEVSQPYFDSTSVKEFDLDIPTGDSTEISEPFDEAPPEKKQQSCSELYDELKISDCGRTIFKYIKGASIKIGISFNTSSLDIKSNDSLYARLVGILTPAPYYTLALKPRYFGRTLMGYQFSLNYTTSSTVDQVIQRGDSKKITDLHTLSIFNLAAFTPSVFLDIMGSEKKDATFIKIGLSISLG